MKCLDEVRMLENGNVEIWWDRSVETTQKMDPSAKEWTFVGFLFPWDRNILTKEDEKITKRK